MFQIGLTTFKRMKRMYLSCWFAKVFSSAPIHRYESMAALFIGFGALALHGQAPSLVWTTNIGAALFAIDAQANVYANSNGTVVQLDSSGALVATTTACPLPSVAQRDPVGNYLFAGSFDGTQNFGGITLVGGWTNWPNPGDWHAGYPYCFLAKYSSAGSLQWVASFGQQAVGSAMSDLAVDPNGNTYVGYLTGGAAQLAHFTASGSNDWRVAVDSPPCPGCTAAVTLGAVTATNCGLYRFAYSPGQLILGRTVGSDGTLGNYFVGPPPGPLSWSTTNGSNGKPLFDDAGHGVIAGCGDSPCSTANGRFLRKYNAGTVVWSAVAGSEEPWTLARDLQSNFYIGGAAGLVAKYNTSGTLIWSNNYGAKCLRMVVDNSGNRFVSFSDGSVARLASDPAPIVPGIASGPQPQNQTVFVGSNVTISVTATGTPPLVYSWQLNGTNVPSGSTATLSLSGVSSAQSGSYSVMVTNSGGTVTSAPALLRVKSVELYAGSQLLTNGTYVFASPPTLSIRSAFASGSSFYTLDGSAPSFSSTYYSGPFTVPASATVRAIGYSADFSQTEEADTVNAVVLVNHTLSASASGGGSVVLSPPGGVYTSTNIVNATAVASNGWSFLYWLGDASGTNSSVNLLMDTDKAIYAVFGTTLSTTVAGNGQVLLDPQSGTYAYGSAVRLTGLPAADSHFGFWGNAATGNTNPLYFTILSPTQTISSIFAMTPADQAALTVLINGQGRVNVSPRANLYPTNQSVTLNAVPNSGQAFLKWSGDAAGAQNPLNVLMNQSKVINANFSSAPYLRTDRPGLEGLRPNGFRLTLVGAPPSVFQIVGTTNLSAWVNLGVITNSSGEVQFLDSGATNLNSRFYRAAPAP
jgi:hypothetical protein